MRLLISCLLMTGLALAQDAPPLEVRGTVVEGGIAVAGATVTLYEFGREPAQATTRSVFATTITDPRGGFRFQPRSLGEYYLEVKKDTYFNADFEGHGSGSREAAGDTVTLDRDHPTREFRFSMTRLGELRGRVIDEDGKPLKGLRVVAHPPESSPSRGWEEAITDESGYFTATKLKPGAYLVRIAPQRAALSVVAQFSEDDIKVVDQDLETSEWPGGGDERSASLVPVSPGGSLSVGTITVRKAEYYRAHIKMILDDCPAGEKWTFAALPVAGPETPFVPTFDVPCAKELLVKNLRPGSYLFALASGRAAEHNRWATGFAEIGRENIRVALALSPGMDIEGGFTAADGAALPALNRVRLLLLPEIQGVADFALFGTRPVSADAKGRFQVKGLQGERHRVLVEGLSGKYFVREIRYSGIPAIDGIVSLSPGSVTPVEVVLDNQGASITGIVADRDKPASEAIIIVIKPSEAGMPFLTTPPASTDAQGRFRIDGLAPGEYRILALPGGVRDNPNPESLVPLLGRGENVTLERGRSQNVILKIVEP